MPGFNLDDIIKNFFTCNREEFLQIFQELLNTIEAEDKITIYEVMSKNYEIIHTNPEIKMSPGNLKDARDSIFPFFWGYRRLELAAYAKEQIDRLEYCKGLN